jgi:RHS repeat-associated protein
VRALIDGAGGIAEWVDYKAFGEPVYAGEEPGSSTGNPYLFKGHRFSEESGLYQVDTRWYDPVSGRYLQAGIVPRDALGNVYTFAGNNPARYLPR